MRCGRGSFLRIGDRADWSYLLPKRLGRGRYVLEVKAIDGAFNRGAVGARALPGEVMRLVLLAVIALLVLAAPAGASVDADGGRARRACCARRRRSS